MNLTTGLSYEAEPLNIVCRAYCGLLREAMATNNQYNVYRDFDAKAYEVNMATTQNCERRFAPWDWNIMVKRHYDPIAVPYRYAANLEMRVVFGADGAWLSWHNLPSTYLGLVRFVPRLKRLAKRHFRHVLLEYRILLDEEETKGLIMGRNNQFVMNGRYNYEYCSEQSMAYLIPDTIIALRAFEELYGMTVHEYRKAERAHDRECAIDRRQYTT